ncbi:MAG: carboxynorspermidine decarboxylase [Lachnospiraceae bacterium]|nr:carboxynorspermidine decarboxylase [Lachnospiraceae bacterium]
MKLEDLRTPFFLIDEKKMEDNLELLKRIQEDTGCKILLAQKAFSAYKCYPFMKKYLAGTTASGLYEAKLGKEEFGGETHVFAPAFREDEFEEILDVADDIVFNSSSQVKQFGERAKKAGKSIGLRVNPECSTQEGHEIYDPCGAGSRLGTVLSEFDEDILPILDGLHFHTLCEQNSDDLATTAKAFEEKFGKYLHGMKWLNMGGGHHITREDYDIETLKKVINHFQDNYKVQVYLEPGEAVVLNAGYLYTEVLDIVHNGIDIAILDTSAACHMPDVIEMPYRPPLKNTGEANEKKYTYRLAGPTCLAGDVIGDYSFDESLEKGTRLRFDDMALYTMVKTNTFNGMRLPDINLLRKDGNVEMLNTFGYEDFKCRL